jgi:2-methylcitrate dehydratase PrpD
MKDGTEYKHEVEHCLGSVERPMAFQDITKKFRECAVSARKSLTKEAVAKVIEIAWRLENLGDATEIIRLL